MWVAAREKRGIFLQDVFCWTQAYFVYVKSGKMRGLQKKARLYPLRNA